MAYTILNGVRIEALTACVPSYCEDNLESGQNLFSETELRNVVKATGIRYRRICRSEKTTALDLSIKAAENIFEHTAIKKDEIGAIVFVTFTPDNQMPNNATLVQHRMGFGNLIPAFDINLACSGYVYGLWISAMMAKNLNKRVLFLDGEKQSSITSKRDKATALLMADAGSATLVAPDEVTSDWSFSFETYGEDREALNIPSGGSRNPIKPEDLEYTVREDGSFRRNVDIMMNGMDVFKFVVQKVSANIKNLLKDTGTDDSTIDFLALHQANEYMLKQVAKRNKIPFEKLPISIGKYGNSSSATIPVTICSERSEILREGKRKILLSGFGAGLSIGTAIVETDSPYCGGVIEYDE
ncbi:MAG TPA: ketoacyl-ACP synthase III [Thermotogota bacterium]|nr:ketoacyl-ACP synthase III [Thermotogota bacterium]